MYKRQGVVGAVACGAIVRRIGTRASVIGTLFCFAAAVTSLGAAPNLWVVIPVAAIAGAAETMWSITTISYRQRVTPPDLLGRVTSIYRMLAFLGIPVGALAAGYMAHATNTRTAYLVGGLALLAFAIASTPGLRSLPTRSVTPVPALPQEPPHAHPRPNEQADHRSPVSREGPIRISDN